MGMREPCPKVVRFLYNISVAKGIIKNCKDNNHCHNIKVFEKNHGGLMRWLSRNKQEHLVKHLRHRKRNNHWNLKTVSVSVTECQNGNHCKSLSDFSKNHGSELDWIYKNQQKHLLNHFKKLKLLKKPKEPRKFFNKKVIEKFIEECGCICRSDFIKNNRSVYNWLSKNKQLVLLNHLTGYVLWDLQTVQIIIDKCQVNQCCKNIRVFGKKHVGVYSWLKRNEHLHLLDHLRVMNRPSTISVLEYISRRSLKKIIDRVDR